MSSTIPTSQLTLRPEMVAFLKKVNNPWLFNFFLFLRLPAAFRSGIRLNHIDADKAIASVPFKRFTQNPFRSTYFACLAMAAELSTGILAMMAIEGAKPSVSMLITDMEAEFVKKATDRTYFTCEGGARLIEAAMQAQNSQEPVKVRVESVGRNQEGEEIARFTFEWSLRKRQS